MTIDIATNQNLKNSHCVYLDYAATTPVDPRVAHKMSKCLLMDGDFGNPASTSHIYGWEADELVETARVQIAKLINGDALEIVLTSGATESDNLALKGVIGRQMDGHIVTTAYEHKAVLDTCDFLERTGTSVTYLQPSRDGLISARQVEDAIRPETLMVSVMHVNNEIGVLNDVEAIGDVCKRHDVLFHVDAAQSLGKTEIDVQRMHIDLMSISAHKIYGPKGVGALFVRRHLPIKIEPQIHGGGHERGYRSGTLATHQIVGFGAAAELCAQMLPSESKRIENNRCRLWSLLKQVPGVHLNGSEDRRVSGILNVAFDDIEGETLLMALGDIAISSGSACTSSSIEPSYVLRAIGLSDELAAASLRFSLGRFTTTEDVDFAADHVIDTLQRLRRKKTQL